jgi:CRISPR-associated endonuclease/helicase Cas3
MWAHSVNVAGFRHALVDHLYGTARLAQRFAEPFGAGDAAFFAGLAHDAGKASCSWQQALLRAEAAHGRVGVDHKTLGVHLAGARQAGLVQLAAWTPRRIGSAGRQRSARRLGAGVWWHRARHRGPPHEQ